MHIHTNLGWQNPIEQHTACTFVLSKIFLTYIHLNLCIPKHIYVYICTYTHLGWQSPIGQLQCSTQQPKGGVPTAVRASVG